MTTEAEDAATLRPAIARLNRLVTATAPLEVPIGQGRILAHLEQASPLRVSQLAQLDHCSQPTMTTQVQRMEAAGWG